jgi:hypothetical protein
MHCTVKPGMYCIYSPSVAAKLRLVQVQPIGGGIEQTVELPLSAKTIREKKLAQLLKKYCDRIALMAGIVARAACGVKRKDYKIWG